MIAGGYSDNVLCDLTGGIGVYTGAMDKLELEYVQYFMQNCLCVSSQASQHLISSIYVRFDERSCEHDVNSIGLT